MSPSSEATLSLMMAIRTARSCLSPQYVTSLRHLQAFDAGLSQLHDCRRAAGILRAGT